VKLPRVRVVVRDMQKITNVSVCVSVPNGERRRHYVDDEAQREKSMRQMMIRWVVCACTKKKKEIGSQDVVERPSQNGDEKDRTGNA